MSTDLHVGKNELPTIYVGKQPIYDRDGDVVAFELLFRDRADARYASRQSSQATCQVIVAAFTDFGLDQLVGQRVCFINMTREFLVGDIPIPFDPGQSVLEIMESVDVDDEVVEGVARLVANGFTIALDDFTFGSHERLLDLATYVKVDLLGADAAVVDKILERCHEYPRIQVIAERLETEDELRRAYDIGFQLFQGHILGRPHVASVVGISASGAVGLRLIGALSAPDIDVDDVVSLINQDAAITYRLLQACNSAATGLVTRVSSVKDAVVLLGPGTVRQWVTLMVISEVAEATDDQLAVTMARARACQSAARQSGLPPDAAFTTGLLSGLADLIGQSPGELAGRLPLTPDIGRALSEGSGKLGSLLAAVCHYERGNPTRLAALISSEDAARNYLDAIRWSTQLMNDSHVTDTSRPNRHFTKLLSPYRW